MTILRCNDGFVFVRLIDKRVCQLKRPLNGSLRMDETYLDLPIIAIIKSDKAEGVSSTAVKRALKDG